MSNQPEQAALSDEFIREVDEEVRQERYEVLWKRYGRYVLIGAIAIVVATAAGVLWRNYQQQQRQDESRAFLEAISLAGQDRADEAVSVLNALADDGSSGYALLARLREAAVLAQNGDLEAAIVVYARVAEDGDAPAIYRDFAVMMTVLQQIDTVAFDDAEARLTPLMADDNAWRYSARELVALAALRENRIERARELLETNADDAEAPQGIRGRATQLLATLDS
jgi:hypothetical protein